MHDQPLVSVGIPTYNRPEGLRRTLECITQQTYQNLEIIVSDNNSSNPEVSKVVERFLVHDNRIKHFQQRENIGAANNFKFVLEKASGEYFMWAADDDEWEEDFIEFCCSNIGDHSSIMTGFTIKNRATGEIINNTIPHLTNHQSVFQNTFNFFHNMRSTLFYGLHKRSSIQYFLQDNLFDYYDCYFVAKQILQGGFITFPNLQFYHAGIDSVEYEGKPTTKKNGKLFEYQSFFFKTVSLILSCEKLIALQKMNLLHIFFNTVNSFFCKFETAYRPMQVKMMKLLAFNLQLLPHPCS